MPSLTASWRAYLRRIGFHQSSLLLGLIYFLIVAPIGVGRRILRRPPLLGRSTGAPAWQSRVDRPATIDDLRHMY